MKNLWPDKFEEPHELAPKQLLEEQAALLYKITKGIVAAEVSSLDQIVAIRIFENPGSFCFDFTIIGPFIDNYRVPVLLVDN